MRIPFDASRGSSPPPPRRWRSSSGPATSSARGAFAERHVAHEGAGRRLRLWAYGHIPLYLGVAGLAAGTVALAAHPDAHGAGPWPFPVAAALAMAGVTLVAASHGDRALSAGWPHLALALLTAALPLGTDGYLVVPASAVAAAVQVMLSARRDR